MGAAICAHFILEGVPDERYREEALLVVVNYAVGALIVGLVKDVLIIGDVLQIDGYFECTFPVFFTVGNFNVGSEVIGLLL